MVLIDINSNVATFLTGMFDCKPEYFWIGQWGCKSIEGQDLDWSFRQQRNSGDNSRSRKSPFTSYCSSSCSQKTSGVQSPTELPEELFTLKECGKAASDFSQTRPVIQQRGQTTHTHTHQHTHTEWMKSALCSDASRTGTVWWESEVAAVFVLWRFRLLSVFNCVTGSQRVVG